MQQYKSTRSEVYIAPIEAQKMLLDMRYDRQRRLDQGFIQAYALAMRKRQWEPGSVLTVGVLNGVRYLMNGQHRLNAVMQAKRSILFIVEEIELTNDDDMAVLYNTFDRGKPRSWLDRYDAAGVTDTLNLNRHEIRSLGACLPVLASGFAHVARGEPSMRMYNDNPQIRMAFMEAWRDEAEQFFGAIKGAPKALCMNIRRAGILAIALVTFRFTGTDAEEFWRNVSHDDGLAQGDPHKAFHYWIRTIQLSQFTAQRYSRYAAAAWNMAWRGRSITQLRAQTDTVPLTLEGTPHDGKTILRYVDPMGNILTEPMPYDPARWRQCIEDAELLISEAS